MLPFARLLRYGYVGTEVVLDIDFSTQSVGVTFIIYRTENSVFSLESGTSAGVVEYNSVIDSNVMKFNNTRYISQMNPWLTLPGYAVDSNIFANVNDSFILTIGGKSPVTTAAFKLT